jgi:hypothetical protein
MNTPAYVAQILAVQHKGFIDSGRGYLQREFSVLADLLLHQLLVQGAIQLHTFFNGDTGIPINIYTDVIDGSDIDLHYKILGFLPEQFLRKLPDLICFFCCCHGAGKKEGNASVPFDIHYSDAKIGIFG